jgi:hypothetical protein
MDKRGSLARRAKSLHGNSPLFDLVRPQSSTKMDETGRWQDDLLIEKIERLLNLWAIEPGGLHFRPT